MAISEEAPAPGSFLDTNGFAKIDLRVFFKAHYTRLLRVTTPDCNNGSASLRCFFGLI